LGARVCRGKRLASSPDFASLHPGYKLTIRVLEFWNFASRLHGDQLRRRQALLQIGDDVGLVLDADREPHHVGAGAGRDLLRIGELAVGGGGGVDDQRAGVADIGEVNSFTFDTSLTPAS
jgi:hypothetical protein